ncbi:MAG TPA: tetratricopeptide repeat protein [Thermoanaerobaculaceae bacterium]|nr:tetratricopeptide repeat protein [Thermoanaerobaculaceae bacterium]
MRRSLVMVVAVGVAWGCAGFGTALAGSGEQSKGSGEALALVAEAQLRLGAGEIAEGLKLLRRATELDPDNPELAEEFGLALADAGMKEEALKQFRRTGGDLSPNGEATYGILLAHAAQTPADLEAAVKHLHMGVDAVPQGSQARLVLAQSLIRMDKGSEAWEQVRFLLDERPDDPRLWILAGESLRQMDKLDEAADWLRRATAVPELRQRATLELVDTLATAQKFKEAADVLGEFLSKEGATLTGMTRWATLLARSGDKDKARQVLDQVLAGDPNQHDALLMKAMVEASDGHVEAAEQLYRKVLAANPDDPDAALGLARLLIDSRHLNEARLVLDGLWKQVDENKLEGQYASTEVAQERAALELLDRKTDDALPWLKKAGGKVLTRRQLALWGEYYRLREAYKDGLAFVRAADVEDDKETARLRSALVAEFSLAAGDEAAANETLNRLFAGGADEVVTALGVLDRRKRFAEAATRAKGAMARLGDTPTLIFAWAAALERSGAWDEAVKQFRKLLAKQPDNAAALNYLGYMFADRGVNLEEARTMLTKAVDLEPNSGAYQDSLGWVYFRLGELDRAEKHLTEALRLEPFDATLREHVGDLFRACGDKAKAAESYRQALGLTLEEAGQKERIEKKLAEVAGAKAP